MDEQLFVRGFNSGYILAKYESDLADKLCQLDTQDYFISGLISGRSEYRLEKSKEQLKSPKSRSV